MALAVLADPAGLFADSATVQTAVATTAQRLLAWCDVSLRVIVLPRLDTAYLEQLASAVPPPPSLHALGARVAGILRPGALAAPQRPLMSGGVLASHAVERLGLEPVDEARRAVVLLVALRERYIRVEGGHAALSRSPLLRAFRAARNAWSWTEGTATDAQVPAAAAAVTTFASAVQWAGAMHRAYRYAMFVVLLVAAGAFLRRVGRLFARHRAVHERLKRLQSAEEAARTTSVPDEDGCTICLGAASPAAPNATPFDTTVALQGGTAPGSSDAGLPWVTFVCRHSFHTKCAQRWLARSDTCPLCREADPLPQCPRASGLSPLIALRTTLDLVRSFVAALLQTSSHERMLVLETLLEHMASVLGALVSLWRVTGVSPVALPGVDPLLLVADAVI